MTNVRHSAESAATESMRATSADTLAYQRPPIQLELMEYDVPFPSIEHTYTETPNEVSSTNKAPASADNSIKIKEDSPVTYPTAIGEAVDKSFEKPSDKIFFLKRFVDGHPRLDVLLEVGAGQLHPSANDEAEFAVWEASDKLYIYRTAGPDIKVLQSVGSIEYTADHMALAHLKHGFGQKTCGFVGMRDAHGQLRLLKLAISGTSFHPHRNEDKSDFVFHAKWTTRVKYIAKELGINLKTIYDAHGGKTSAETVGNWRAGHVEKKLSTHIVWTFLTMYGMQFKTGKVYRKDLRGLRLRLREEGLQPKFEIHLSRGPCGTSQRPGRCVPFEENVILDGSIPPKAPPRKVDKTGHQERIDIPCAYDSEAEDLDSFVQEVEGQANILRISSKAARQFGKSLRKFKRLADDIKKPYPPTPVTEEQFLQMTPYEHASSQSHFWEDSGTPFSDRQRRSAALDRRARKNETRRRRAAAAANEAAHHSAAGDCDEGVGNAKY
ncbi:hypothetical protein CT0861_12960 [Colletotrichum tofieldiae]|uniref:Uncharacterized protein n=1 Tax=Colletotrichum tofieldiae TaxID=708197 RepID=A0A166R4R7_9PEZI|nr:hypothetical protein CT0861_12960 [Colletotrichum tofieldiae]